MSEKKTLDKKYENAILFLCKESGGSIMGLKKIYKLLYYIDFDNYEYNESMSSITGNIYVAWKMGPVPKDGKSFLKSMVKKKLLMREEIHLSDNMHDAVIYTALKEPDMSVFNKDEKFIIKRVIRKYGLLTGKQLETLTHTEAPYIATEKDEEIDYGLALYRETDFGNNLVRA